MKKKMMVSLIVLLIVALAAGYDYWRSLQYKVQVTSIDPQPAVADGQSTVTVKVKVTKNNAPVEGHDIFGLAPDGGGFEAYRVKTDEAGEAVFAYHPYVANAIRKAKDVQLQFSDQSNSVLIQIEARTSVHVKLTDPDPAGKKSDYTMDDIFGDE
ncbi:hypothetical protein [Cohnella nanjingensis]|uniref:Big-1 domain-containing protein n=1 Tax=Cohnella nanjingensis TaxID=1387779 RepID=A0A7X0RNX5_9BACL|nr:hypothetical protein [Cohnella nanjingensis]MBB6670753.1 hypothetical protein [Cohnella nanjingensis]